MFPVARADGAVTLCRVATFPPHCRGSFLSAATETNNISDVFSVR